MKGICFINCTMNLANLQEKHQNCTEKNLTSKLLRSLNPGWAKTSPTAGSIDCWGVIQVLVLPVQQNNQLLILDIFFCEVWGYQVLMKM